MLVSSGDQSGIDVVARVERDPVPRATSHVVGPDVHVAVRLSVHGDAAADRGTGPDPGPPYRHTPPSPSPGRIDRSRRTDAGRVGRTRPVGDRSGGGCRQPMSPRARCSATMNGSPSSVCRSASNPCAQKICRRGRTADARWRRRPRAPRRTGASSRFVELAHVHPARLGGRRSRRTESGGHREGTAESNGRAARPSRVASRGGIAARLGNAENRSAGIVAEQNRPVAVPRAAERHGGRTPASAATRRRCRRASAWRRQKTRSTGCPATRTGSMPRSVPASGRVADESSDRSHKLGVRRTRREDTMLRPSGEMRQRRIRVGGVLMSSRSSGACGAGRSARLPQRPRRARRAAAPTPTPAAHAAWIRGCHGALGASRAVRGRRRSPAARRDVARAGVSDPSAGGAAAAGGCRLGRIGRQPLPVRLALQHAASVSLIVSPRKAGRPASISKSTQPNAQMSERASRPPRRWPARATCRPPCRGSDPACVAHHRRRRPTARSIGASRCSFASPKSRTFTCRRR